MAQPSDSLRFRSGLIVIALICASSASPAVAGGDDPSRWEKAIRAFEKLDRAEPPPKNAVLFVGSSSIRLWKLAKSFPGTATINRGFGGSHIADSLHYAERIIIKHQPRTVIFYAGDNDIAAGKTPRRVLADFQSLSRRIHADLPRTKLAFIAIKPSLKRWKLADHMKRANALVEKHCAGDERLHFVDVWTPMLGDDGRPRRELFAADGLHLNEAGYRLWTKLVKPYLE